MEVLLATTVFFAAAMMGLGAGLLLQGRELNGSCGSDIVTADGEALSCGVCVKKEAEMCPSDDPYVRLAQISHPNPRVHH